MTTGQTGVLVIEDDEDIALAVRTVLERAGWAVWQASEGRPALRRFHEERPDLVVLDLGLPGDLDGWEVLERIRDLSDLPVLILSAHSREEDKVRGLQQGADDYLSKPFGNDELRARVQALMRRTRPTTAQPSVYDDGVLEVRYDAREVRLEDQRLELTPLEFRLLCALTRGQGTVLSLAELLDAAWNDPQGVGPDRVKFAVLRLRRKLGRHGQRIESVRGFGYRYVAPADSAVP